LKKTKGILRIIFEIALLGVMVAGLALAIKAWVGHESISKNVVEPYWPPGELYKDIAVNAPKAYPPPRETAPIETEEPIVIETAPVFPDVPPTLTPWPTFTPYPSPTLGAGPTPTPVPFASPATDAAGNIFFLESREKGTAGLYSLSTDARGDVIGAPSQRSDELNITWGNVYPSPDGSRLAIFGEWCAEAVLNTITGKVESKFSDTLGTCGRFLDWHPDNRNLLIIAEDRIPGLWLVDTDTWGFTTLAVPGIGKILGGAVSPDGRRVIYSYHKETDIFNSSEIWTVNTNGRDASLLFTVNGSVTNLAWSPDGRRVAFSGDGLMVMEADGKDLHNLDLSSDPGCFLSHYPPIWSPDSRFLAIISDRTDLPFTNPWSPDTFQDTNICLVDVESGKVRALIPGENSGVLHPAWSPDASQIVFVSNRSGTSEIWAVNVDGSNLRQLTTTGQALRFPYWRRP
jgi:Tol biopolymer transport system component